MSDKGSLSGLIPRPAGAFLGLGAAVLALLAPFQSALLGVHFHHWPKILIIAILALLAVLIPVVQTAHASRSEEAEQLPALNDALVGDLSVRVARRPPQDLGIREGDTAAIADAKNIADAMPRHWVVTVVGPQGVGKSHAAWQALRQVREDAIVLCPVDADGLAAVLRARMQLMRFLRDHEVREARRRLPLWLQPAVRMAARWRRVVKSEPAVPVVLWLDDLDRFAEAVQVDLIRSLLASGAGSRVGGGERTAGPGAWVVATIRDDTYRQTSAATDSSAHAVRRLMSCGAVVVSPASGDTVATGASTAQSDSGSRTATATDGLARPSSGVLKPTVPALGSLLLLGTALFTLIVVFVALWLSYGDLNVPPPLAQQAAAITTDTSSCATATGPDARGLSSDDVWTVQVSAGSCGQSDYLSVYTVNGGCSSGRSASRRTPAPSRGFTARVAVQSNAHCPREELANG